MAHLSPHHGTGIPNYNIFGHQHLYKSYKDKTHLESQGIRHHRWLEPAPAGPKTRAELQQARHRGRIPDKSYDFDGDGVVGQLDYFIGRSFDRDNDGRLSKSERLQAEKALDNGFMDKYSRGFDTTGDANRGSRLMQKRGIIIAADNSHELGKTYPPHPTSHKVPAHDTQTALHLSRTGEMKGYGNAMGEKMARALAPVREPQPANAQTDPRSCPISHINERAEADHQLARYKGGLLPVNTAINPERENRGVGMGYEHSPVIQTRGQLLDTRKELMRRDCEALREKGEEHFPPNSVRKAEHEARAFEFRRPAPGTEPKTLTTMKDQRRRDRIEYDMNNFSFPRAHADYPRFSDNGETPFWEVGQKTKSPESARREASRIERLARTHTEPALKVNEVKWHEEARDRRTQPQMQAAPASAGFESRPAPFQGEFEVKTGSKTVKRFTADCIEHGQGRNKPRLFNSIKPLPVGPKDLEPLDIHSSLEPVRKAAYNRIAEEEKRNSMNPRHSALWSEAKDNEPEPVKSEAKDRTNRQQAMPARDRSVSAATEWAHTDNREPRFFGSPTTGPKLGSSAVRCGGFQSLDWSSHHTKSAPVLRPTRAPPAPQLST
eukprot:TRINITY_DN17771_c0_g1_i1.p1 TRINITY_DN17771_c0_g1~~TRINITY_DN17771_c0_g1_i1.p1  ORF type:complete len:607 (+),score=131.68 TRINITY_DN17771_c0_g1_i1:141-1961(+)